MSALSVGGVVIPVAVSSPVFTRSDAVDRGRVFSNDYFASQSGGAANDWQFSTPPVTPALAATYKAALGKVNAQLCSGDILELPTMCFAEWMGGKPVRKGSGHMVVVDFMLHESQGMRVLLRYSPGDTIAGESFTRSTTAYQINASGVLESKAINVKRDGHYIGGVRSLLLEGASTNPLLWANDFFNGAWSKITMIVGTGVADPAGGTSACVLTATGVNSSVLQDVGAGASIIRTNSVWLRRRTGSGVVEMWNTSAYVTVALTASWQRVTVTGSGSVSRAWVLQINTPGDAVDVWCAQQDDFPFATSEIPTTTVAVTRGADSYPLPFTTPPQEMTAYAKFVEKGTRLSGAEVFAITNAAAAAPAFAIDASGTAYRSFHASSAVVVASTPSGTSVIGDKVEHVARLFGDGSTDLTQSLNSGAATAGTQSAANALATAWAGQLCWLNSAGTAGGYGFTALQSFKIVAGSRSLDDMRGL